MPKFKLAILAAAIFLSAGSFTQDCEYQQGVDAYLQGDYVRAADHYYKAATAGHAKAQNNLAAMYFMGQGVTEDALNAQMWAEIAHSNGVNSAKGFKIVFAAELNDVEVKLASALAHECKSSGYSFCGMKAYASN
ncbi:MAG: hypothetical protein ACPGGK_03885 [Pikeienuella sp.]